MTTNNDQQSARLEKLEKEVDELKKAVFGGHQRQPIKEKKKSQEIDFSLNIRTFVKRYAAGKSGPRRFILLLAYLAKGETYINVELSEIRTQWNKMSAKNLLGKFNRFYPNEAKTRGWADSKKYGTYCLTNEWQEAYELSDG